MATAEWTGVDAPVAIILVGVCVVLVIGSVIWIRRSGIKYPRRAARTSGRGSLVPYWHAPLFPAVVAGMVAIAAAWIEPAFIALPLIVGGATALALAVDFRGIAAREVLWWQEHGWERTKRSLAGDWAFLTLFLAVFTALGHIVEPLLVQSD